MSIMSDYELNYKRIYCIGINSSGLTNMYHNYASIPSSEDISQVGVHGSLNGVLSFSVNLSSLINYLTITKVELVLKYSTLFQNDTVKLYAETSLTSNTNIQLDKFVRTEECLTADLTKYLDLSSTTYLSIRSDHQFMIYNQNYYNDNYKPLLKIYGIEQNSNLKNDKIIGIDGFNVDIRTGILLHNRNLVNISDYVPINLNLFYDITNRNSNVFNGYSNGFPCGFRTNFHQYVYQEDEYYIYLDNNGLKHVFGATADDDIYYEIYGTGLVLYIMNSGYQIKDGTDSILTFDSVGRLISISRFNKEITIVYTNNKISTISTNNQKSINFVYNTSYISVVFNNTERARINLSSNNILTSLLVGTNIYYYYYNNGLITSYKDANNNYYVILYDNLKRVYDIKKTTLTEINNVVEKYHFIYNLLSTKVEDKNNVTIVYQFDEEVKCGCQYELIENKEKNEAIIKNDGLNSFYASLNNLYYLNYKYNNQIESQFDTSGTYPFSTTDSTFSVTAGKSYILTFEYKTEDLYLYYQNAISKMKVTNGTEIEEVVFNKYIQEYRKEVICFKANTNSISINLFRSTDSGIIYIKNVKLYESNISSNSYIDKNTGLDSVIINGNTYYLLAGSITAKYNNTIETFNMTMNDLYQNQLNMKKGLNYFWYNDLKNIIVNVNSLALIINNTEYNITSLKIGVLVNDNKTNVISFSYRDYNMTNNLYKEYNIRKGSSTLVSTTTYNTYFNPTNKYDEYGVSRDYFYNSNQCLTQDKISKSGTIITQDYTYDTTTNKTLEKEISHIGSNNCETIYQYDSSGKVTKITNPLNQDINYTYDNNDNVLSIDSSVDNVLNKNEIEYNYELVSKLKHNSFNYNFEYDTYNMVNKIKQNTNTLIEYTNDIQNRIKIIKYATNYYIKQEYDKYGRILYVSDSTNGSSYTLRLTYVYSDNVNQSSVDTADTNNSGSKLRRILIGYNNRVFSYDNLNRVTGISNTSNYYSNTENTYDNCNRIYTINDYKNTLSLLQTIQYKSNVDNRINKISNAIQYQYNNTTKNYYYYKTYSYNGTLNRIDNDILNLSNYVLKSEYQYVSNCNLISSVTYKTGYQTNPTTNFGTISYSYDELGNITNISDTTTNFSNTINFEYDGLGRLTRENNLKLNKSIEYIYDSGGNITEKKIGNYTTGPLSPTTTINYGYNTTIKDRLISYNGVSISYDSMGNPTSFLGRTHTWIKGRLLNSVSTSGGTLTFEYDNEGRRTLKYYSNTNNYHTYIYDNNGNIISESITNDTTTNTLNYIYLNGELIGFTYKGNAYRYQKNIMGDIIGILDSSSSLIAKYVYDAWGNVTVYDSTGSINTSNTFTGNVNPFRFRSNYYDRETGYYYLKTRYYVPEVCRFINLDQIEYLDPQEINGLNLYAYCLNNPVMYSDGEGTFAISSFLIGLAISSLAGWTLSQILGSQIAGGIGSCINGAGAVYTGIGLLSFGPVGWILGGALIIIGAGTIAFGVNDIVAGVSGTNYIQSWTGMSDSAYFWINLSLNIASTVGTIAGNIYMKYNPRYPGNNPNKIPDGFNDRKNLNANYYNPKTRQSLHPDLNHPEPEGPHWDWKDSNGEWWRLHRFWRVKK